MNRKIDVDRLVKEELDYELKVRGGEIPGTVEGMRKELRVLLKAEKDRSFVLPKYPFTHEQDIEALRVLIENLRTAINNVEGDGTSGEVKKIWTRLAHACGRLDRCPAENDEERKTRSGILLNLGRLEADLTAKLNEKNQPQETAGPSHDGIILTAARDLGFEASLSDVEETDMDEQQNLAVPKSVPVAQWKIKYSGDRNGASLHGFLERVNELRIARNVSREQLFRSAVDLFDGQALIWYRANKNKYRDWEQLAKGIKDTFLPSNYDEKLYEEILSRTQGKGENISVYVAIMTSLFSRLCLKLPERLQLRILLKNIDPFYQTQLALTDIKKITELVTLCRLLEARRLDIEEFSPPPRRFNTFEAELGYVGSSEIDRKVNALQQENVDARPKKYIDKRCFKCGKIGHIARSCYSNRKRCFRCQTPDVTIKTCPKCNASGNEKKAQ